MTIAVIYASLWYRRDGKPFADLRRLARSRQSPRARPRAIMAMLGLPLVGGALFVALFAAANPLIAQALAAIRLPSLWQY